MKRGILIAFGEIFFEIARSSKNIENLFFFLKKDSYSFSTFSHLRECANIKDKVYRVIFDKAQRAITPGQSVVFYKGQEVLGGGNNLLKYKKQSFNAAHQKFYKT